MEYVVGKDYDSDEVGSVIYIGYCEERGRHMFKLFFFEDCLRYEGSPPEGYHENDPDYIGKITEMG